MQVLRENTGIHLQGGCGDDRPSARNPASREHERCREMARGKGPLLFRDHLVLEQPRTAIRRNRYTPNSGSDVLVPSLFRIRSARAARQTAPASMIRALYRENGPATPDRRADRGLYRPHG